MSGFCRALLCAVKQWNSSNNASALHSKALRSVLQVSCAASSELQERRNIEKCPKSSRLRLAVGSLNSLLLSYANEQRLRCFGVGEESRQQPTKFAELQMIVVHFVDFQMCFFRLKQHLPADGLYHIYAACTISNDFGEPKKSLCWFFMAQHKTGLSRQFYCIANDCLLISSLFYMSPPSPRSPVESTNEPAMIVI